MYAKCTAWDRCYYCPFINARNCFSHDWNKDYDFFECSGLLTNANRVYEVYVLDVENKHYYGVYVSCILS